MKWLAQLHAAGWLELGRAYPDRGSLGHVPWYNALLRIGSAGAGAVVAADAAGIRLAVGRGLSAVFLPWSEVTVSGRRDWVDTAIDVCPAGIPAVPLALHLDDADADALLRPAGVLLPARRWSWGPAACLAAAAGVLLALLGVVVALDWW